MSLGRTGRTGTRTSSCKRSSSRHGRGWPQAESITVGRCNQSKLERHLEEADCGVLDRSEHGAVSDDQLEENTSPVRIACDGRSCAPLSTRKLSSGTANASLKSERASDGR